MITNNESLISVLNDLIAINHDRIIGYEKAISNLEDKDMDLKALYTMMVSKSKSNEQALSPEVAKLGGAVEEGTTISGKIYRGWMDVKATFSGHDRLSSLESCEFGEDAAQKAYQTALESDAPMTTEIRQMIANQKADLHDDHNKIKALREAQKIIA